MFRTTALSAAALLGLATLTAPGAQAAGETCEGVPATLVGTPGQELVGTEGADVVVTNAASVVDTLGGDDLVCVTGPANPKVETGAGDDVVVSTLGADAFSTIKLGPGSDRFTGSASTDAVYAGGKVRRVLDDHDRDVIDGGPANGRYGDYVVSGEPGVANADVVRVAGGSSGRGGTAGTVVLEGVPTPESSFAGGGGGRLEVDTTGVRHVRVDLGAGSFNRDGASAPVTGFADVAITDDEGPRRVTFRGTGRDEALELALAGRPKYDVEMGGGDDEVTVEAQQVRRRGSDFSGGRGHDQIGLVMHGQEVRLDLRRKRLLTGRVRRAVPIKVASFEDAEVVGRLLRVVGTPRANDIRAQGCDVVVRALGGDDKVSPLTLLTSRLLRCHREWARFEGGRGADLLVGDSGIDVLVGGPGRDVADGGAGRDTCSAEKVRHCEKRV